MLKEIQVITTLVNSTNEQEYGSPFSGERLSMYHFWQLGRSSFGQQYYSPNRPVTRTFRNATPREALPAIQVRRKDKKNPPAAK